MGLLQQAPQLCRAWTERVHICAVAHLFGAFLALVALCRCLGPAGLAPVPMVAALLVLEFVVRKRCGARWLAEARAARSHRESVLHELLEAAPAVKAFGWERLYF